MSHPSAIQVALAIQVLVALGIACFSTDSIGASHGVLAGQATLLGVLLGAGRACGPRRLGGAALGLALLAFGAASGGGGWEFVLLCTRTIVVGGFFWSMCHRRRITLSTDGEPWTHPLFRISLRSFFVLTLLLALFLGIGRLLDAVGSDLLLVLWVILLGTGYAAMSILASLAPLEPRPSASAFAAYALVFFSLAGTSSGLAYWQTDRWSTAMSALVAAGCEAIWVCGTLALLRSCGFRLATSRGGIVRPSKRPAVDRLEFADGTEIDAGEGQAKPSPRLA